MKTKIIVNGREATWSGWYIAYADIAKAATSTYNGTTPLFTVAYSKGPPKWPSGTLTPDGGAVPVVEGMIFNVSRTDNG